MKTAANPEERLRRAREAVTYTVDRFFRIHDDAVRGLVECDDPRGYDILRALFREEIDKQIAYREARDAE